jgi:hypothetical protein
MYGFKHGRQLVFWVMAAFLREELPQDSFSRSTEYYRDDIVIPGMKNLS